MGTLLRAKRSWAEWKLRTSHPSSSTTSVSPSYLPHNHHHSSNYFIRWHSPAGGAVKINCDGTKSHRGTSAGFVIRTWKGGFVLAGTRYLEQAPILVAEAVAVRDGLKSALEAGYHHIEIEGDNQVVLNAIQGRITPPWQISTLIADIKNLAAGCEEISFKHVYREANMAADWVAKYGCVIRSPSLTCFSSSPSREFLFILIDDNLGRSLVRGTT